MAYVYLYGACGFCGRLTHFNPDKCPSARPFDQGEKQPICRTCFDLWNKIHRTDKGLEPIPLDPQAYEPLDEQDMYDG